MSVITFGAVPNGKLSDDFEDATANGAGKNGCGTFVLPSDLVDGKYKIRMVTNPVDSPVYYKDPGNVRIHMQVNKKVSALLEPKGRTFARCFSIKWDSGNPLSLWAGDEIHGGKEAILGQGPAPSGLCWAQPPNWLWIIRGGGNPNVKGSYKENRFTMNTIQTGIYLHTFMVCTFSPDPAKGSIQVWTAPHLQQMHEMLPYTKLPTAFPDPIKHYPILSNYWPRSVGGWHNLEYLAGGYVQVTSDADIAELREFQVENIGYNPWGPPVPKLREIGRDDNAHPPTITLGYDPVPNAYGYRFFADGIAVSIGTDPMQKQVTFKQGAKEYAVLPLFHGDLMTYRP